MLHSEVFLAFLFTSIGLAIVTTALARFRIPTIVGFIITGIVIGPSGLNWIKSLSAVQSISEFGIVLLMFSLGLEISLTTLKKMIKPLLSLGLVQVFATIIFAGSFFKFVLGHDADKSFVFGACLALSSTAVVLKLLHERRDTETPYGRASIIILLFQDIVALPLMAVIPLLASSTSTSQSTQSLLSVLIMISAFVIGCFVVGFYVIPGLFSEVLKTRSREVFFFSIISTTFVTAYLAEKVGLSMSIGAFLAGVLISESPISKQALAEMSPLRDIFLGFFFASVGMMIDLKFIFLNFYYLAALLIILMLIKFFVIYIVVKRNSHSYGVSFTTAMTLTQIGEFSFILAALAYNHQIISQNEFQFFLALAVCSLLLTPMLFSVALRGSAHSSWPDLAKSLQSHFNLLNKKNAADNEDFAAPESSDFQEDAPLVAPRKAIVIGLGHAGQEALLGLKENGIPSVGIDINIENVKEIQNIGGEAIFGDSTRPEVLESAGIKNAFLVILTVNGSLMVAKSLAIIKQLNPNVKVLLRVHYLRELDNILGVDNSDVVVSETVTSNEILKRALSFYGLESKTQPNC